MERRHRRRRLKKFSDLSGMGDLNSRPPRPERGALPSCANPRATKAYIGHGKFASALAPQIARAAGFPAGEKLVVGVVMTFDVDFGQQLVDPRWYPPVAVTKKFHGRRH